MYELENPDIQSTTLSAIPDSDLPSELTNRYSASEILPVENLPPDISAGDEILLPPDVEIPLTLPENPPSTNEDFLTGEPNLREGNQNSSAPVLEYSSLFGGNQFEQGNSIAIDQQGNIYLTGSTNSADLPITPNAVQNTFAGGDNFGSDAFVAKIAPDGTLVFSTYLGGSDDDFGRGIAVDNAGNIYVTGTTESTNFPIFNALQSNYGGGLFSGDTFVTKLSPDGSNIIYSTYLGGQDDDESSAIAVDAEGNAYVTGNTGGTSPFPLQPIPGFGDFPTTDNARQNLLASQFNRDAFVSKISADGSNLVYSTLLGGNDFDISNDIVLDSLGNAYITGDTRSPDFPVVNPVQGNLGGDRDVFVAQLNSDGSDLLFSTFYGAGDGDAGSGIALDNAGNIIVAGNTGTRIIGGDAAVPPTGDFPTVNGFQNTFGGGGSDGIVIKINSDRTLGYASLLGGQSSEFATRVDIDATGSAYVTGNTGSGLFPALPIGDGEIPFGEPDDAFVTKISNDGAIVEYSIRVGGTRSDQGNDIAVDSAGNAYIAGSTNSTDFPVVNGFDNVAVEGDAFVVKLASNSSTPVGGGFEGFDESVYLAENPGVADAVTNGFLSSGFEHWLRFGFSEGRQPQIAFNEEFYLAAYPDVAEVVANGSFSSGLEHFVFFGAAEGREAIAFQVRFQGCLIRSGHRL